MTPEQFQRLKTALTHARKLPKAERVRFLETSLRDSPDLLREAHALLEHTQASDVVMDTGLQASLDDSQSGEFAGTLFGPYRILRRVGQGGMGIVYEAEDTRLERRVALKFLRSDYLAGTEAAERFHREARAAASLDHPNICTVYAIETIGSKSFISMAFIDGQTLRSRIEQGPCSLDEAMDLTHQLAVGLAHAHQNGVIHRDITPRNLMVTPAGQLKITDFGLARSNRHATLTTTGVRMGTVAYMSPEQTTGDNVNEKTDVWPIGVILHELLTGHLPFQGESDSALQYNIVHGEPARIRSTRNDVPPQLEALCGACLRKSPEERPSAKHVAVALRRLRDPTDAAEDLVPEPHRPDRFRARLFGVSAVVILALATTVWWQQSSQDKDTNASVESSPPASHREPRLQRLTALPQTSSTIRPGSISPNGRLLALAHHEILEVVSIETGVSRRVPGPDSGFTVAATWLPDSESLMCWEVHRGTPRQNQIWLRNIVLNTNRAFKTGDWTWPDVSPDGKHAVFLRRADHEIWIADLEAQHETKILETPKGSSFASPSWSPGSDRVAFLRAYRGQDGRRLLNLETAGMDGDTTVVIRGDPNLDSGGNSQPTVHWMQDGRLVFARFASESGSTGELWSIDVDPATSAATSTPIKLVGIDWARLRQPTASTDTKRLTFLRTNQIDQIPLIRLDAEGDSIGLQTPRQLWPGTPGAWTRNGESLVFTVERVEGDVDIYLRDVATGEHRIFVKTTQVELPECLTPDGQELIFRQGDVLKRIRFDDGQITKVYGGSTGDPDIGSHERVMCTGEPSSRCILGRIEDRGVSFYPFSPVDGSIGERIARISLATDGLYSTSSFTLSPDGEHIAWVESRRPISILSLQDGSTRIVDPGLRYMQSIAWSSDGTWLCVSGTDLPHYYVARVELDGALHFLWRSPDVWASGPIPSPDGSHVAFRSRRWDSDVWMIEDF